MLMQFLNKRGKHHVTHEFYSGKEGIRGHQSPLQWRFVATVHDRCLISMTIDGIFDVSTLGYPLLVSVSSVTYEVAEVLSVGKSGDSKMIHERLLKTLNEDEWKQLIESGGNLSIAGIAVRPNEPLEGSEALFGNNKD